MVGDWPELYDPFKLHTLNVQTIEPNDFERIRNDTTYEIEVPAWFWAENEEPILVSIRRKSATALPNEQAVDKKVSYKIDINEYHDEGPLGEDICVNVPNRTEGCVSKWKSVKKLSLENGDDQDVVREGVAWYLHRLARDAGLKYDTGLASWVKLKINGVYQGVYVNVEQPDKQFLKNRNRWEPSEGGATWLYKRDEPQVDSSSVTEMKEGLTDEFGVPVPSPTSEALCYGPFLIPDECPKPSDFDFKTELKEKINIEGMLTFGAVSAFHSSPDDLFSKGKNFYYADQSNGDGNGFGQREYFQWDLDSAFHNMDPNTGMYRTGRRKFNQYEEALVADQNAPFREEYNAIIARLIGANDPVFDLERLTSDLQAFEELLRIALAEDPYPKGAAASFGTLTEYFSLRIASMRDQLPAEPPPPVGENHHIGDLDGNAVLDGKDWRVDVTFTVHDENHVPVNGVDVGGSWSDGVDGDVSCSTAEDGTCSMSANITNNRLKRVKFAVGSVIGNPYLYNQTQNHDDDGTSDGNTITLSKPR